MQTCHHRSGTQLICWTSVHPCTKLKHNIKLKTLWLFFFCKQKALLAPQSGAVRIGAYRDSQPTIPSPNLQSTHSFWALKPVYTKSSRPVCGSMWQSMVKYIRVGQGRGWQQWKPMDNNVQTSQELRMLSQSNS